MQETYQLYIRSSEAKSKDFAVSGEVNTGFSVEDVAVRRETNSSFYKKDRIRNTKKNNNNNNK